MDVKNRQKLRKFLKELEGVRGRHTELVSVYVPAGYDIIKIIQHLQEEQGTAENIKDKSTRLHVIDSLEKAIRHLRLYKRTPENGLAVFAGNASERESQAEIKVWSIEPPMPIQTRLYRCDQTFVLDILQEQLETKEIYGLIVLDNREGTIGLLRGTLITEIANLTSGVPGKIKAGGQCSFFNTIIESETGFKKIIDLKIGEKVKSYDFKTGKLIYSKCLDKWEVKKDKIYEISTNNKSIKCSADHLFFLYSGSTKIAKDLKKDDVLLTKDGEEKIISIIKNKSNKPLIDISVENKNFIANGLIVHNSAARFARLREEAAHEFYKRIAEISNKEFYNRKEIKGILVGGPGPTKETFLSGDYLNTEVKKKVLGTKDLSYTGEFGLHELVDKSHDLLAKEAVIKEKQLLEKFFTALNKDPQRVTYNKEKTKRALEYGAVDILLLSEDLEEQELTEFENLADKKSTHIEIISNETKEGQQFKQLGGVGALLRFPI